MIIFKPSEFYYIFKNKKKQMSNHSLSSFTSLVQIGHGAFGTVYKAKFIKTQRVFALKQMSKNQLQKRSMVSQINNQIKIMKNTKFEHIIRFYDCFEDGDNIYLVMELAENGQLFDKLKRQGRFSEEQTKNMIKDVVAAVQFLHSQNPPIIHRDIKPENLLLDKNNRIKLADFGWSNFSNKPRKTYCGTFDYLAPEMIDKSGHDQRLDIWCIGVLVYELLTGKTPFLGDGKPQMQQNILNVKIEFPSDFPPMAKDFVMGMIKRNPDQRMSLKQIKAHPWLSSRKSQVEELEKIRPIKQGVTSTIGESISTQEPKSAIISHSHSQNSQKQIINTLNIKIRELQEENMRYKIREKQGGNEGNYANNNYEQITRLNSQIRRLKPFQELTQKYKKEQQKLWDSINLKEKQLINLRVELKKSQDETEGFEHLKKEKEKYVEKTKRLQKEIKTLEEKNRNLEEKLDEANSGIEQRVKNGEKIMISQVSNPEFLTYLQEQILELTQKFETSKHVYQQMIEKERKNQQKEQELARLRIQEKKVKQIIKAQLREMYENEKDDILEKARLQLEEQRKKWFKEREELLASFQETASTTNQTSSASINKQDLYGELRNLKELNQWNEKTIYKQKLEIEDLKQELKRKK